MGNLLKDVVKDIMSNSYQIMGFDRLNESNVNRILKHGEDEGFVIISANRSSISSDIESDVMNVLDNDNNSLFKQYVQSRNAHETDLSDLKDILKGDDAEEWLRKRNKQADQELKSDIQKAGWSYSEVFGGYHGSDDVKDSFEPSYIVYNKKRGGEEGSMLELIRFAVEMCKKYNQDSVYIKKPGEAPFYINADGEKVSKRSSNDTKVNRNDQEFYTTTKRDKTDPKRFTSDIDFPDDNEDFTPEKIFEGMFYKKGLEYTDKMKRSKKGEIFL